MKRPLISIQLDDRSRLYAAGSQLAGDYQIDVVEPEDVEAVELSALWYTEGKGDEDLAVHHFERLAGKQVALHELRRFEIGLPNSPLSYEGSLIRIRWSVRVRVFLREGKDFYTDAEFQLGEVGRPAFAEQKP